MDENKNLEQQMSTLRVGLNNQMNEKRQQETYIISI